MSEMLVKRDFCVVEVRGIESGVLPCLRHMAIPVSAAATHAGESLIPPQPPPTIGDDLVRAPVHSHHNRESSMVHFTGKYHLTAVASSAPSPNYSLAHSRTLVLLM